MNSQKITILDGGMGCELQAMGAPFHKPEWSALTLMKAPAAVMQAHQAFIDAGAEIITTNSYAIVPFHIGESAFQTDGEYLIRQAAEIARMAADGTTTHNVKVAGCLPPPLGSYRPDLFDKKEAQRIYKPLIKEQERSIDFWLAETMSSIAEAHAVAEITEPTNKPLWLAYSLSDTVKEGEASILRSGESIIKAVEAALDLNVAALLFNCSQPEVMTSGLSVIKDMNIPIPYGVYANTFPPKPTEYLANDGGNQSSMRNDITESDYFRYAQEWVGLGATIIGGCCGIRPSHIQTLSQLNN